MLLAAVGLFWIARRGDQAPSHEPLAAAEVSRQVRSAFDVAVRAVELEFGAFLQAPTMELHELLSHDGTRITPPAHWLASYDPRRNVVHVAGPGLLTLAGGAAADGLAVHRTAIVVLIHEVTHAAQCAHAGWAVADVGDVTPERVAMLEGHACRATRRLCGALGLAEALFMVERTTMYPSAAWRDQAPSEHAGRWSHSGYPYRIAESTLERVLGDMHGTGELSALSEEVEGAVGEALQWGGGSSAVETGSAVDLAGIPGLGPSSGWSLIDTLDRYGPTDTNAISALRRGVVSAVAMTMELGNAGVATLTVYRLAARSGARHIQQLSVDDWAARCSASGSTPTSCVAVGKGGGCFCTLGRARARWESGASALRVHFRKELRSFEWNWSGAAIHEEAALDVALRLAESLGEREALGSALEDWLPSWPCPGLAAGAEPPSAIAVQSGGWTAIGVLEDGRVRATGPDGESVATGLWGWSLGRAKGTALVWEGALSAGSGRLGDVLRLTTRPAAPSRVVEFRLPPPGKASWAVRLQPSRWGRAIVHPLSGPLLEAEAAAPLVRVAVQSAEAWHVGLLRDERMCDVWSDGLGEGTDPPALETVVRTSVRVLFQGQPSDRCHVAWSDTYLGGPALLSLRAVPGVVGEFEGFLRPRPKPVAVYVEPSVSLSEVARPASGKVLPGATLDVVMEAAYAVRGRLAGPAPGGGVRIEIVTADGGREYATPSSTGRFEFRGLPGGPAVVRALWRDAKGAVVSGASQDVNVGAGAGEAELILQGPG